MAFHGGTIRNDLSAWMLFPANKAQRDSGIYRFMYVRRACAAVCAVVLELRQACVRPELPCVRMHHSDMLESWVGLCWITASKPESSRGVRSNVVMMQDMLIIVSLCGLRPVILEGVSLVGVWWTGHCSRHWWIGGQLDDGKMIWVLKHALNDRRVAIRDMNIMGFHHCWYGRDVLCWSSRVIYK